MGDFINNIVAAPVANLLIIAGIAFLGISVIGKVIGKIEPGKTGRIVSGVIGMILLITGLLMHFGQGKMPKLSESKPSAMDKEIEKPTNIPTIPSPTITSLPDLFVSEFKLIPQVPIQGKPVSVQIGIYNKGKNRSGPFKVQWWAGENFPKPEHVWRIKGMAAGGGRILKYTYRGYRSWYAQINTKVVVDPESDVKEYDKKNNIFKNRISVKKR